MLRVKELAATGMERSSVKAGMTGGRKWRQEIAGHGGDDEEREWDIETGEGRG